jgi:hypothetical protein
MNFEKLATRFRDLARRQPAPDGTRVRRELERLEIQGARLWQQVDLEPDFQQLAEWDADEQCRMMGLERQSQTEIETPEHEYDASTMEVLIGGNRVYVGDFLLPIRWRQLVSYMAVTYPHAIPGGHALSSGKIFRTRGLEYHTKIGSSWQALALDYAMCCDHLHEMDLGGPSETVVNSREKTTVPESNIEGKAADDENSDDADQAIPAFTKCDRLTLVALATFDPIRLATIPEICGKMKPEESYSEKSVGETVTKLLDLPLAERPLGKKDGVRLTISGRRMAKRLAD